MSRGRCRGAAARALPAAERYDELAADLRALVEASDTGDGELRIPSEYCWSWV